ncbi:GTP-binding protein, partial [Nonomuraea sp. NPDC049158]|uniref:GTP-binding protein n=1 Tax=Nonomuraea sp. NPDC049158 TaxID=3155649 RepID=UPI00340265CC
MYVVATAGHVDHGKSTLVRALTGMEPDRLEEERRRGLTIELGYAWTTLPSGRRLAFVDVPGHERFLSTMLAGVGPVPAVLFVVAADEGWMPQSEEHVVALEALGVRHCLLAVTRADLADPAPALDQARTRLTAGLGVVEAVVVSGLTGQGLDELRAALDRLVAALPAPDPAAPVRLWIDRAFSVIGSGTVVTGTLPASTISVGDELALDGEPVRVRALESLKEPVSSVTGVARVAVNLRGHGYPERGRALVTPGRWTWTDLVDVRISPVGPERGVVSAGGEEWRLPRRLTAHIGSAAVTCEVRTLGGCVVRLRLARPLPLHLGDVLLLRDPGRDRAEVRVLAGASVLDVRPPALGR